MSKALTKEDLIYILQNLLMLSQESDNALHRANDNGLYVKDYTNDLNNHINDSSVHVTQNILNVLSHISVDENDELLFDGQRLTNVISREPNNAIEQKSDGIYVNNTDVSSHLQNDSIHVTEDDKKAWNDTLAIANNYVDQEIDKIPIHDFHFTTQLPTENQDEKTLYFLAENPDRPLECTYTIHFYKEGAWHTLGVTNKTLSEYITKEQFTKTIEPFAHNNKNVLDKLTEDEFGALCYSGQSVSDDLLISSDPSNMLIVKDGKLYVGEYSGNAGSRLLKVNLHSGEINKSGKYKLKDSINNYSLILIEYYYKPNDPQKGTPGCIQTAVIDPITLNEAYSMGMLYILQYGYGVMTSNSQIHIVEDELTVDYYHNVCIYKITGIGKDVNKNAESTTE